jgi:hypothetical protein
MFLGRGLSGLRRGEVLSDAVGVREIELWVKENCQMEKKVLVEKHRMIMLLEYSIKPIKTKILMNISKPLNLVEFQASENHSNLKGIKCFENIRVYPETVQISGSSQ